MPARTTLPRDGTLLQQQIQDVTERALRRLEASVLDGMNIVATALGTSDTRIYHGLGRVPLGYFPVRKSAAVDVFEGATPETLDPLNYITLRASTGGVAIQLAVF